jgi:23S rRNA (uracil1939-C5)-methyltransferase
LKEEEMEQKEASTPGPKSGDEIELTIESMSGDGGTVARHEGMVYFVEDAVPGDRVRARIRSVKKNFTQARAVAILAPSPLRVDPRCRHFGVCGGCRWQHLAYDAQLDFKRRRVEDAFVRIGGFASPEVLPVIGCESPWFYRNKMEFTFSGRRWLTREEMEKKEEEVESVYLGLHVPERYDKVVDLEECWLQSELSSAILASIREVARGWNLTVYNTEVHQGFLRHLVIRQAKQTGEVMVNLVTSTDWPEAMENLTKLLVSHFPEITTVVNNITSRKSMVALGEVEKIYHGPGYIRERLGGHLFHISANSFFQTNTLQAERLYGVAKDFAGLTPSDVVYDLYSGTGTIALFLSEAVERVVGIEMAESAIRDAGQNARLNKIPNCYFLQGDLKTRMTTDSEWLSEHPKPSVIVADPPRSGMHEKVVEKMIRLAPRTIVYVSCNPSTQARDAKLLAEGGYNLKKVQPVDMFPHTDHIEAVALFTRS